MKNKKTQIKDYQAEDYTFAVIKEFIEKNKKDEIFKTNPTKDFQYRLILIEFEKSFFFESIDNIENEALNLIKSELEKIRLDDPIKVPIPKKYDVEYSGKIMLRLSPESHKQLCIESYVTGVSLNKLISNKVSDYKSSLKKFEDIPFLEEINHRLDLWTSYKTLEDIKDTAIYLGSKLDSLKTFNLIDEKTFNIYFQKILLRRDTLIFLRENKGKKIKEYSKSEISILEEEFKNSKKIN